MNEWKGWEGEKVKMKEGLFFQLERRALSEIVKNISFKESDAISQE